MTSPPEWREHRGSSAAGSACASEPQTVPRLRVATWPTKRGRPSSGQAATRRRALEGALPHQRADAHGPFATADAVEPGDPAQVDDASGSASRRFMSGTSDWPPASGPRLPSD